MATKRSVELTHRLPSKRPRVAPTTPTVLFVDDGEDENDEQQQQQHALLVRQLVMATSTNNSSSSSDNSIEGASSLRYQPSPRVPANTTNHARGTDRSSSLRDRVLLALSDAITSIATTATAAIIGRTTTTPQLLRSSALSFRLGIDEDETQQQQQHQHHDRRACVEASIPSKRLFHRSAFDSSVQHTMMLDVHGFSNAPAVAAFLLASRVRELGTWRAITDTSLGIARSKIEAMTRAREVIEPFISTRDAAPAIHQAHAARLLFDDAAHRQRDLFMDAIDPRVIWHLHLERIVPLALSLRAMCDRQVELFATHTLMTLEPSVAQPPDFLIGLVEHLASLSTIRTSSSSSSSSSAGFIVDTLPHEAATRLATRAGFILDTLLTLPSSTSYVSARTDRINQPTNQSIS